MSSRQYLLLSHLKIHNANAMSSTFTVGVPAMTAWLGGVHALERTIRHIPEYARVTFHKLAVSFHHTELQVYHKPFESNHYISGTGNPLVKKGAGFVKASFIEEPRIHLDVSLLIEMSKTDVNQTEQLSEDIRHCLQKLKFAGGDIEQVLKVQVVYAEEHSVESAKRILRQLMPGYVLIERRDLLQQEMENGADGLDGLLHYLEIKEEPVKNEGGEILKWKYTKAVSGWLVPIAVGFHGISPSGKAVKNQRDPSVPHCFTESVVTLGEFRLPVRFDDIDEIMWNYHYDEGSQYYLCENRIHEEEKENGQNE